MSIPRRYPRLHRLIHAADFQNVFQTGTRYSNRLFTFFVKPSEHAYSRLGIAVAKKTVKLAVTRNLVKRIMRESFRAHQQVLDGTDIVIVFHNRQQWDKVSLRCELDKQWLKLTSSCKKS